MNINILLIQTRSVTSLCLVLFHAIACGLNLEDAVICYQRIASICRLHLFIQRYLNNKTYNMKRKLNTSYSDMARDNQFVRISEDLQRSLAETKEILYQLLPLKADYDKLTLPVQIELDLFIVYALNSLHWINLRLQGVDTYTHPIKNELERVKVVIAKWKEIKDRFNRPTVNIEAAKRFIRSGLYDPYRASAKRFDHTIIFRNNNFQ